MSTSRLAALPIFIALSCNVHAADLPALAQQPTLTAAPWTGFYVGAIAGYALGRPDIGLIPGGRWYQDSEATFLSELGSSKETGGGFTGGGALGYDRQFGAGVAGLEADFAATLLRDTRLTQTFAPFDSTTGDRYQFASGYDAHWLSTVRGRVGRVIADRTLLFVSGGLALAQFSYTNGYIFGLGPGLGGHFVPQIAIGQASRVNAGWTVGAGIEQSLSGGWSVKAEYLYADLGKGAAFSTAEFKEGRPTNNGYITTDTARLTENIFRVGLNYRFAAL